MTWKLKTSLLSAAVAAAMASQAQASFQYDLRLAPGQPGAVDAHNVTLTAGGANTTYTLQLWGQITGDTNLTNDGWTSGFVSEDSVQGSTPAFTAGGVTGVVTGTHASTGSSSGLAANITNDGVQDWGSGVTTSTVGYTFWRGGNAPGYVGGTADAGQSEQVNANTWEVLLATYTVAVNNISSVAGTTSLNLLNPANIKNGVSTAPAITYYQDDPTIANADAANKGTTDTSIGNVLFTVPGGSTPEPASLGVLALGGLALMNRRRRA